VGAFGSCLDVGQGRTAESAQQPPRCMTLSGVSRFTAQVDFLRGLPVSAVSQLVARLPRRGATEESCWAV
jgi:hypothetical protein